MPGYVAAAAVKTARVATAFATYTAITPADATPIGPFAALYVGTAGDVALVSVNATTAVVFKNLPAGTVLPAQFQGVNATNTTAANLVGLG